MLLLAVKGEHVLGVKQEHGRLGSYEGLETGLLQHKSSVYYPHQQSVPHSGVGCSDPGLPE